MRFVLFLVCIFLFACSGSPDGPYESHQIFVTGSVTDLDTDAPIMNASVILHHRGTTKEGEYTPGETLASVKTDQNGHYLLSTRCDCRRALGLTASAGGYQDTNGMVLCRSIEQIVLFKLKPLTSHEPGRVI